MIFASLILRIEILLFFYLGKIDCRCNKKIITYQDIIKNIVDNYFEVIELNVSI